MSEIVSDSPLDGVVAAAKQAPGRGLPPVHLWNPGHSGEIDIVIRSDGRWVHEGATIHREGLVRLFSTVLRKDPDGYWLVTPVEKMKITVEDAPFVAIAMDAEADGEQQRLIFRTNVGDEVVAGPDHGLRIVVDGQTGEPRPYLHVRRGLEALIARPVFYQMVEMAEERDGVLGLVSDGVWFALEGPEASAP